MKYAILDTEKPRPLDEASKVGGSDGARTRNLPESSSGRSYQITNILSSLFALDLTLASHGFSFGTKHFLIDKHPGALTPGISASALVVTKKSIF